MSELFVRDPDQYVDDYRRTRDSLNRLANELEGELSRLSISFRRRQDRENITAARVRSLLPDRSVLVEYLKYDSYQHQPDSATPHYLVVVMSRDRVPFTVNLGNASAIDSLVDRYRLHMLRVSFFGDLFDEDQREYEQISQKLYDKVWRPIENLFENYDLVFIAADGALSMVSFAGLTAADASYLIERSAIHYLSCGRDLIRLNEEANHASGLFALGDPDFDALASSKSLEPLASDNATCKSIHHVTRNVRSSCQQLNRIMLRPLAGNEKRVRARSDCLETIDSRAGEDVLRSGCQ